MSRIIKEGEKATQRIEFVMANWKYTLDVVKFNSVQVSVGSLGNNRAAIDMDCATIDFKPCTNSDFMEDVKALAKQYGYELLNIEVK